MNEIHPGLIEKYQLILEKDPRSKVFAPLSEAYRKMGLLEEAFRISSRGVTFHPQFPGGHIALANVLMEKGQYQNAKESLEKAIEFSPENILAFQQLGECCLRLRLGKEALRAFKMVLLFSPQHERALKAVQKLETLTADEFEDDVFKMDRIASLGRESQANVTEGVEVLRPSGGGEKQAIARDLERQLSLLDAYLVRGQVSEANELAALLKERFPQNSLVQKRVESLTRHDSTSTPKAASARRPAPPVQNQPPQRVRLQREVWVLDEKIKFLKNLLSRVREVHDHRESLV